METLSQIKPLLITLAVVFVLVFLAILVDLASGIYKAKINNVLRTSKALRCTINKFIQYEGSIVIAFSIDVCLNLSQLWTFIKAIDLNAIPIVSLLMGAYLCIIEIVSVRENADTKVKKREKAVIDGAKKLVKAVGTEKMKELIKKLEDE